MKRRLSVFIYSVFALPDYWTDADNYILLLVLLILIILCQLIFFFWEKKSPKKRGNSCYRAMLFKLYQISFKWNEIKIKILPCDRILFYYRVVSRTERRVQSFVSYSIVFQLNECEIFKLNDDRTRLARWQRLRRWR